MYCSIFWLQRLPNNQWEIAMVQFILTHIYIKYIQSFSIQFHKTKKYRNLLQIGPVRPKGIELGARHLLEKV